MPIRSAHYLKLIKNGRLAILTGLTMVLWYLWPYQSQAATIVTPERPTQQSLEYALDMVVINPIRQENCGGKHITQANLLCEKGNALDALTIKYLTKPSAFIATQVLDRPGIMLPSGYATFSDRFESVWPRHLH